MTTRSAILLVKKQAAVTRAVFIITATNPKGAISKIMRVKAPLVPDTMTLSRSDKVMGALNRLKALFCRH